MTEKPRRPAAPAPPCTLVIFGASGDLTRRLLVPSLCNLRRARLLPERFAVIGIARAAMHDAAFRQSLAEGLPDFAAQDWRWLAERMHYLAGEFDDPATYERLARRLEQLGTQGSAQNLLFYLATPATLFAPVVARLGAAGLAREQEGAWRRVIIEKPFGSDLPSAQRLNREILQVLDERQVYRIDHFLGKETVQSIMAVRFANSFFEPIWNRDHIDHVQITASETVGVEQRGRFYEQTGALRDMVPNHLFQLLTMTAMEPPTGFDCDAVRNRKADVLKAIPPVKPGCAVRGQYDKGTVLGKPVNDYRHEPDVAPDSPIETYVALKLEIDTWRWAGVPFYLRTGKSMSSRTTEIGIRFRQAPLSVFRGTNVSELAPNWLILQIQPDEGISLQFEVKRPGQTVTLAPIKMSFAYKDWFPPQANVGYETLIYDCMIGDASLFQRADMVESAWRIVQPLLDAWGSERPKDFPNYKAGSAGPDAADKLLANDGRAWLPIDR